MEWWDEDPELLGATLGMLAAWHDDGTGSRGSVSARGSGLGAIPRLLPLKDETVEGDDDTDSSATSAPSSHESERRRKSTKTTDKKTGTSRAATTPSSSSSSSSTTTGRARTINVSRERRKQELQTLRDECAALQEQLRALRDHRDAMLRPHFGDALQRQLVSVAPVWENMATRQFQARRKSELRNARLKHMLQAHVRVAEELIRAIELAHQQQPASLVMPSNRLPAERTFRVSDESQRARLNRICEHWPEAFALSPKFRQHGPLSFHDMRVEQEDDGAAVVIEVFSSQVVPFSVTHVEQVLWRMFNGECGNDDSMDEDTVYDEQPSTKDDVLTLLFTTTSTVGGGERGSMSGKWVIKRFRARDGSSTLFVTHSFSEPSGFQNELDTALIDDDSWARVVDAHSLGHEHLPAPLSVVQHVRRLRIAFGERGAPTTSPPPARHVQAITRWFVQQMQDELTWAQQTLESELISSTHANAAKSDAVFSSR